MTDFVQEFIERLEKLDRGDMARLKRSIGRPLGESGGSMLLFYRLLPAPLRGKSWEEEDYFMVAGLFGLSPKQCQTGDLGYSMQKLAEKDPKSQNGLDRRMLALLDSSHDTLPFRLRQVIRLLESHEMPINWAELLRDIRNWERPGRRTQKKWARSYFGGVPAQGETEEPEAAAGEEAATVED